MGWNITQKAGCQYMTSPRIQNEAEHVDHVTVFITVPSSFSRRLAAPFSAFRRRLRSSRRTASDEARTSGGMGVWWTLHASATRDLSCVAEPTNHTPRTCRRWPDIKVPPLTHRRSTEQLAINADVFPVVSTEIRTPCETAILLLSVLHYRHQQHSRSVMYNNHLSPWSTIA